MNKELEEARKVLNIASGKEKGVHVYQDVLSRAIETVLNYIENSIAKQELRKDLKILQETKVDDKEKF